MVYNAVEVVIITYTTECKKAPHIAVRGSKSVLRLVTLIL